jgi:hypothetical protein
MLGVLAGRRLWLSVVLLWAVLLTQGSAKAAETQDAIARHVRAVETGLLPPVGIAGTDLRGRPLRARMRASSFPMTGAGFSSRIEATVTFNPEHGRAQELVWLQSGYGTTATRPADGKP